MLGILLGGQKVLQALPVLKQNSERIQRVFGILMIVTAVMIYLQWDRKFQAYVLEVFPNYGTGLTQLEDNAIVDEALERLGGEGDEQDLKVDEMTIDDRVYPTAPELIGGTNWIGTEPLTLSALRGKVVLIDFWTYTCINCIRTLPYLTSWDEKYRNEGLVIIGVHAPEFEFEKETENVIQAMADFGVEYPVVQDNDFKIWRAYNNRYWPAKYLIDAAGKIRYTHFGEGKYAETELKIQELLEEADLLTERQAVVDLPEFEHASRTPETYLGYWRMMNFVSPEGVQRDGLTDYTLPESLRLNEFGFDGKVSIAEKYSKPQTGSRLNLRFMAKDVHLVMRSAQDEGRVRIYLDDEPISQAMAGPDVIEAEVEVVKDREYHLVQLDEAAEMTVTIEFLDDSVEVYAFTFG
jgi:thiol-disulfide isomerase/thioredoxin